MKWNKNLKDTYTWSKWFAWYPVIVKENKDDTKMYVWLEYVEMMKINSTTRIYRSLQT